MFYLIFSGRFTVGLIYWYIFHLPSRFIFSDYKSLVLHIDGPGAGVEWGNRTWDPHQTKHLTFWTFCYFWIKDQKGTKICLKFQIQTKWINRINLKHIKEEPLEMLDIQLPKISNKMWVEKLSNQKEKFWTRFFQKVNDSN